MPKVWGFEQKVVSLPQTQQYMDKIDLTDKLISVEVDEEVIELYEDIVQSYIGNHLDSTRAAARYLYDAYTYDSELEQTNLRTSDIDEVIMFGKIPRKSIAIPTITNDSYSPDFMYMVKKADGTKELNIIVETKGVETPANLRGVEEKKISCAKKFFNQLREDYPELNVNFKDQLNNQQLRTIIDDVLREA